jgi:hypothetical protein
MSVIQVGLVDMTGQLDPNLVEAAAAAINLQVMRDLPQFWNVQATVRYLPNATSLPAGVWPVRLVRSLPPGEGGFHSDRHKQPFARVIATPGNAGWTIDASHETIEMLVDPSGNRMQSSPAIRIVGGKIQDGTGQFNYLVEACDPCEANNFGYTINGVLVSDFITPHFYDPVVTQGTRYSFTGALTAPRQILRGGYISFVNLQTDQLQQILWINPGPPQLNNLGTAPPGMSVREWIDNQMAGAKTHRIQERMIRARKPNLARWDYERRSTLKRIARARAQRFYARRWWHNLPDLSDLSHR